MTTTSDRPTRAQGSRPSSASPDYGLAKGVFYPSAAIIIVAVLFAVVLPGPFSSVIGAINSTIVSSVGWYYILVATFFVIAALVFAFSRLGSIKLGKDDEEPEYKLFSWFAMLFAAGMGIGLVFWGAAEPLTFFASSPPPNIEGLADSARAPRAMSQVFLHWGFHAWAIYVVVGLAVAYATHRRGRPLSVRWALEPLLGRRTNTWIGDVIDVIAIVGTLFGVATSLGFGVNQIAAGLIHLGILPDDPWMKVIMVVVITALATLSVASGLDKGIKFLSNLNLSLAALLLVAVLIMGPTLFLLRDFVSGIGTYLQNFVSLSFQTFPFFGDEGASWLNGWTTFYWGWWISWSPFVGVFIARISRGRTVREFIIGVLLVPTLVTMLWFTVMGGTAIYKMMFENANFLTADGGIDTNLALFQLFETLPASTLLSGLAIILVTIFFITSADSGAFVVDMIAHRGDPEPPRITRIFWAVSSGAIAAVLLGLAAAQGGDGADGMSGLQALALVSALPWSVVMVAMVISMYRALTREVRILERLELRVRRRELVDQVTGQVAEQMSDRMAEQVTEQVTEQVMENVNNGRFSDEVADRVYERVTTQTGQIELEAIQRAEAASEAPSPRADDPRHGLFDRFRKK
ncbi:MAG: BCCT family transporter [Dermabacter sp.]|nr:BCCT family transporter [Dermabacter sp.]